MPQRLSSPVVQWLAGLTSDQQIAWLLTLSPATLKALDETLVGVTGCDCPTAEHPCPTHPATWQFCVECGKGWDGRDKPRRRCPACGRREVQSGCECPPSIWNGRIDLCEHVARAIDEHVLSADAQGMLAYLLTRSPEYIDPPPPITWTSCKTTGTKSQVMAERLAAHFGLWHPDDLDLPHSNNFRPGLRLRNGADFDLDLDEFPEPPAPGWLEQELAAFRAQGGSRT